MSGELIIQDGTSGFVSVGTGLSLTAGTFVQASSTNTIAALMAAGEEDYPEFDVQLQITAGTPTENNTVQVHLRSKADGTNEAPAPGGDFAPHRLGNVVLDNATGYYYAFGLRNLDKNGTLYLKSNEASTTLTASLSIRMRSDNTAV